MLDSQLSRSRNINGNNTKKFFFFFNNNCTQEANVINVDKVQYRKCICVYRFKKTKKNKKTPTHNFYKTKVMVVAKMHF